MSLERLAKAAQVTAAMLERRDLVKRVMGARYKAVVIGHWQKAITSWMGRHGKDALPAALEICEALKQGGFQDEVDFVVAAVVEMLEREANR